MSVRPGDRRLTSGELLLGLVAAAITFSILTVEYFLPPPHFLGRLTTGPRKYWVLLAFGVAGTLLVRRVERWWKRRKAWRSQSGVERTGPPAA